MCVRQSLARDKVALTGDSPATSDHINFRAGSPNASALLLDRAHLSREALRIRKEEP
jgi:hypothetical protein